MKNKKRTKRSARRAKQQDTRNRQSELSEKNCFRICTSVEEADKTETRTSSIIFRINAGRRDIW
jgi:hypothetical protein